jgi:hypothetical protein
VKLGLSTLREDHRLRVFENRVQRKIFGCEREEVAADWRGLHNEELHNLYASINIIRVINSDEMGSECSMCGRDENCIQSLVRKPEGRSPLRTARCRQEDNIRMDLREIGWEGVDWILLAQDRDWWWVLVNAVMNHWVLYKVGSFLPS